MRILTAHRLLIVGWILFAVACESPDQESAPQNSTPLASEQQPQVRSIEGEYVGGTTLVGQARAKPLSCGTVVDKEQPLQVRGPKGGTITLDGHELVIAPGVVPDDKVYKFRLRKVPANRGAVIADYTPNNAPLEDSDNGDPRFQLTIYYAPCSDPDADKATLVYRWSPNGNRVLTADEYEVGAWSRVFLDDLSTYAAAAPGRREIVTDTLGRDTTHSDTTNTDTSR
jgi:hypothetical protein